MADKNQMGSQSVIGGVPLTLKKEATNLSAEQRLALESLLQGRPVSESAQAAGVARRTIYKWLKNDAAFAALYNQWHEEMKESCRSRLLMLAGKATAAIERALEAGDAKSAMQLLKGVGLLAALPERPTDEEEVRQRMELEQKQRQNEIKCAEIEMRTAVAREKMVEEMWKGK